MADRSQGHESGAALIEASVALILLILLTMGVTTVAGTWGPATGADRLAVRAARMAGSVVDPPRSDLDLLSLVGASLGRGTLHRLLIYRPDGPGGDPMAACARLEPEQGVATGVTGWCTAYGPEHLDLLRRGEAPPSGCAPGSWEVFWCPEERRDGYGGSAWIGVLVELHTDASAVPGGSDTPALTVGRAVVALDPPPRERPQ